MDTVSELRREYKSKELDEGSLEPSPIAQFKIWFEEARAAGELDPDAMTLATSTRTGEVSARIVLLRGSSERGFVFFSNFDSRKGREIDENARAALVFYWATLNRQVRVEGSVQRVDKHESEAYFRTRPRGSQIGAWASPQSSEIENRRVLEAMVGDIEKRFADREVPLPPNWGGFRVSPVSIEFWQGRESRLHDRIVYRRADDGWKTIRLAP
jgi:pyridoxamine 5'-phosphate oxidase